MQTLYNTWINDKQAELLLAEDKTVIVQYDKQVISRSGGETWRNIDGIYQLYIQFCVNVYMKEQQRKKEYDTLLNEAGSLGWTDIS